MEVSAAPQLSSAPDRSRIRVLLVGRGLGLGGMERLLAHQVRFGDTERFEYSVAYVVAEKDDLVQELRDMGVEVHHLGGGRLPWPLDLRRLMSERRFDVVHVHSPLVAAAARLASRTLRGRPRLVYTEHNSWDPYRVATRWANRLTYPLDDAQIAVSRAAWSSVPERLRRRLDVLDHGIDLDTVRCDRSHREKARERMGVGADELVVGTVANFRPEKNYEGLLRVASRVTQGRRDVRFVSIGQGPLLGDVTEQRDRAELHERFTLMGHQPDATALMAGFDVFVLASHWEGLPVAFMEARALGLPVVVTAVGGLVDHVRDGIDGVLVEPGSDDALVAALGAVLDDDDLRARLGSASAAAADVFDARVAVAAVEERYSQKGSAA